MKKIVLLTLAMLVFASIGCYYSHEKSDTGHIDYDATLYDRFEIETENGEITTSVHSNSVISVTLTRWASGVSEEDAEEHLSDIEVYVTEDTVNRVLRIFIDIPNVSTRNYGCDADIELPESLYVDLVTSNGKIKAAGHQHGLRLVTSNGRIDIAKTAGEADLFTSNGDIGVDRHAGDITGETANGEVTADVIMPVKDGTCRFISSNGAITVAVPDSVSANIYLKTSNGEISVDADLHTQGDYNSDEDIYESTMGDASGEIYLETANKDVTLKKL